MPINPAAVSMPRRALGGSVECSSNTDVSGLNGVNPIRKRITPSLNLAGEFRRAGCGG